MSQQHNKARYALVDPAHLCDGLFVPTSGLKREVRLDGNGKEVKLRPRLYVSPRDWGGMKIGYQGFEQLGVDDQSFLLAICGRVGISGATVREDTDDKIAAHIRDALKPRAALGVPPIGGDVAIVQVSRYALSLDAGYKDASNTQRPDNCINRLRNTQVRIIDEEGNDYAMPIIAAVINHKRQDVHLGVNMRLAGAVFSGQSVQVSLFERAALESEHAKLLHCWLSSHVRKGGHLGFGNGVHLDSLLPHVYGSQNQAASRQELSRRRGYIRDALIEIAEATSKLVRPAHLAGAYDGWAVTFEDEKIRGNTIVHIRRPKELPIAEAACGSPSAFAALLMTKVE